MKNLFKKLEELYEKFDRKNFHNMEVACHNCGDVLQFRYEVFCF